MLATALTEDADYRLEEIIPILASKYSKVSQFDCDRCGCLVSEYYGETLLGSLLPLSWSVCPTCGFRDLLWGEQKKLQISLPKQWNEHNHLIVNLSLINKGHSCQDHWIYATLHDKATGMLIFKSPLAKGLPNSICIPPHCEASPDLHTFRIWHIHTQSFSFHRRRVAYLT